MLGGLLVGAGLWVLKTHKPLGDDSQYVAVGSGVTDGASVRGLWSLKTIDNAVIGLKRPQSSPCHDPQRPLAQWHCPLAAHCIRATSDVDLFVTITLYERLRAEGWEERELDTPAGGLYLSHGIYDANDTWDYGTYKPTPEALIANAEMIEGIPFAPLMDVLRWKAEFGRPKDVTDVELIQQYISAQF